MAATEEELPFLRFPPFPEPPPGVQIIPFEGFKPSGIRVSVIGSDPAGGEPIERDGLGIVTVLLKVKHIVTDDLEKKKKKKRKKGGAAAIPERKLAWWEQWIEAEQLRPTMGNYPAGLDVYERLPQAAEDFTKNRAWPPSTAPVVGLWSIFRIYIGVLADNPSKKTKEVKEDEQPDVMSDEEFGEMRLPENDREAKERIPATKPNPYDVFENEGPTDEETRMDAFCDNPEKCVSVFLSSHFRERGMIWNEIRCRDAPKLIAFFLDYLLRNHAIPQSTTPEDKLRAAHDVATKAEKELPATFEISRVLPGILSDAFVSLWGSRRALLAVEAIPPPEGDSSQNEDESAEKEEPTLEILDENLAATLGPITMGPDTNSSTESHNGWGNSGGQDGNKGSSWGTSNSWDAAGGGGWGGSELEATSATAPWTTSIDDPTGAWSIKQISLIELMGPTLLPLTHRTGVVEESIRRIVGVFPPVCRDSESNTTTDPFVSVEEDLLSRFGRLILAPWGEYASESSEIQPPEIINTSRGAVKVLKAGKKKVEGVVEGSQVKPHDPLRDTITVLIEESAVDKIVVGMGLGATWIQLVRDGEGVNEAEQKDKDGSLWYLEQLMMVVPSFWAE